MTGAADDNRIEEDALGQVRVPADRLWGAQTQRSLRGQSSNDTFPTVMHIAAVDEIDEGHDAPKREVTG